MHTALTFLCLLAGLPAVAPGEIYRENRNVRDRDREGWEREGRDLRRKGKRRGMRMTGGRRHGDRETERQTDRGGKRGIHERKRNKSIYTHSKM